MAMFLLRNIMEMVKSGIVRKLLTMHCSTCLLVRSLVKFFGAFKNSQEDVSSEILLSNQHCGREDSKGSWNRKHIRTSRKIDLRL